MFNFLNPKLLPKIHYKPPCTDNYEADNLISNQYSDRIRGFIAYPSIKPPVELVFNLLCDVNIFYIVLNTTVGSQRCSGVEIFAKNSNTSYLSIAKATYDTQGVIFCNSRKYSRESPPPAHNSNFSLIFFRNVTFRTFLNASSVKVVIFRTEKSVPCIASAEIWGVPSKRCSQKTIETLHRLMSDKNFQPEGQNEGSDSITATLSNKKDSFVIPDDFKDDLTYELMTIPYTLPSGKTVDKTTLEKHEQSEKSFGRKPCDPFTGIKFNNKLKPILNVGLKSRIDMFLLKNSHRTETFALKRSLAGVENSAVKKIRTDLREYSRSSSYLPQNVNISEEIIAPCASTTTDNDLDLVIRKAKTENNIISFLNSDEIFTKTCSLCKNTFQFLYKLPCKHLYCRNCLLDICKVSECKSCGLSFVKSEVIKCDL